MAFVFISASFLVYACEIFLRWLVFNYTVPKRQADCYESLPVCHVKSSSFVNHYPRAAQTNLMAFCPHFRFCADVKQRSFKYCFSSPQQVSTRLLNSSLLTAKSRLLLLYHRVILFIRSYSSSKASKKRVIIYFGISINSSNAEVSRQKSLIFPKLC